jgi:hypothetical protein
VQESLPRPSYAGATTVSTTEGTGQDLDVFKAAAPDDGNDYFSSMTATAAMAQLLFLHSHGVHEHGSGGASVDLGVAAVE